MYMQYSKHLSELQLWPLQTIINITMGKTLLKHRFYDVTFLPKNSSFPFHFGSTPIFLTWCGHIYFLALTLSSPPGFWAGFSTALNILSPPWTTLICSSVHNLGISFPKKTFSEKAMATHSSTLAWKIPWMEEPGGLQSMGSLRVGHDWDTSFSLFTFMHWRRKWQPTPVFLAWRIPGTGSLMGCHLQGCRVGHDWSDLAAAAVCLLYQTENSMKARNLVDVWILGL